MREGSLGFMLQGVSQQPLRMQAEGHVREQINMYPDPNVGLTSRPATKLLYKFAFGGDNSTYGHSTVTVNGTRVMLMYKTGVLKAYSYTGVSYTINAVGSALGYIGMDMVFTAVGGKILCANREVVVATSTPTETGVEDWGYLYALGGEFSKTYKVEVRYADATVAIGTYTAPDGDVVGDAAKIAPEYIITQLRTSLTAHANWKGTSTATIGKTVLLIEDSATTFTLTTVDGAASSVLKSGVGAAETFADVPAYAPEGYIIRVRGEVGTLADDVYLKFDSSTTNTVGAGFGDDGVWREYHNPADGLDFDVTTMPHEISLSGSTLTIQAAVWPGRLAGNAETAPEPSFVGKTIMDMGEMQGRLWLLSQRSWSATQTKDYRNFFRKSASVLIATDPIDIGPDSEDEVDMQYGIAYDKNLVLFAKKSQFLLRGDAALTPNNAAMQRTTKFEMSSSARPAVAGQTVMMPYTQTTYSGINEMFPTDDIATNTVEGMTKVVPTYILGVVDSIQADANAKIVLVHTTENSSTFKLFVYNFLWENSSKVQSAWHTWEFPDRVVHQFVADGVVYIWTNDNFTLRLCELRPDRPVDSGLTFHCTLDYKNQHAVVSNAVALDRGDYIIVSLGGTGYAAGTVVTPTDVAELGGVYTYTLPAGAGSQVYVGVQISREVVPTRPVLKDWRGSPDHNARIVVHKYAVDFVDSGDFAAYMANIYRFPEFAPGLMAERDKFPVEDDPTDSFATTITSGTLDVPWGEDQFVSTLILRSVSHQPTTIVEIRWYGQPYPSRRSRNVA